MINWRQQAACKGADPNLFFAAHNEPAEITEANADYAIRTYCNNCPVRGDCLRDELSADKRQHGVWGGLREKDRHGKKRNAGAGRKPGARHSEAVARVLEETT